MLDPRRGFVTVVLLVATFTQCGRPTPDAGTPAQPPTYTEVLAEIDRDIAFWSERSEREPRLWLARTRLADEFLRRARLTGDFDDYAAAQQAIARAFDQAPVGAGPFLSRARLHFALHRLDGAESDLQAEQRRVVMDDRLRAAIVGMRADLAFHRGQYEAALSGYRESLRLHRSVDGLCRLAHYQWKTGDFDGAEATYDAAEGELRGPAPMLRAWFDMQRGLLDLERGRWDEALSHYRNAGEDMSGWWLIDEHIAEVYALRGEREHARAMYIDLVARTGNPEFMSALAVLVEDEEGLDWFRRARAAYEQRMAVFPEAALGHALEYAILARDPRAVAWAERNHRLRSGGEACVLLARAYHSVGADERARDVIETVLATPYRAATLYAAATTVYDALGDRTRAAASAASARAINPAALD